MTLTGKKPKIRWTAKRKRTLSKSIDDVLIFCGLSEAAEKSKINMPMYGRCKPSDFVEAEAFLADEEQDPLCISNNEVAYFGGVTPNDVPKFDISICKAGFEPEDPDDETFVALYRLKQEPLKAARGKKLWSPHVASLWTCYVHPDDGEYHSNVRLVNLRGKKWTEVGTRNASDWFISKTMDKFHLAVEDEEPEVTHNVCQMLLGVMFSRDLEWRVVIKGPSGVSLSLPTDYSGAMAAFRNRDPEGSGRREALKHWVKQHYRKSTKDDDEILVREHLRGRTPFRWLGMDCELVVSPWDLRRNERLREEREALRRAAAAASAG